MDSSIEQLKVVTFPFEPFITKDENGDFGGFEVKIVETIGEKI